MRCPKCSGEKTSVVDSRSDGTAIRRRRECQDCKERFTTYERVEIALPMIVKKDGRREPFRRDKIRTGLTKACEKRPISAETIEETIDRIERRAAEMNKKELPARQLGDLLMEELSKLDKIAYVRFASVYREFSDLSQFKDTLESLGDNGDLAAVVEPESAQRAK